MKLIEWWRVAIVAIVVSASALAGCHDTITDDNTRFSSAKNVDIEGWRESVVLSIPNIDTTSQRRMTLFARRDPAETSSDSLRVAIMTITPDGVAHRDSVTMHFERGGKAKGKLIGRRGSTYTASTLYRDDVVWDQQGQYIIYVTPTSEPIIGIEAIGVEIRREHGPQLNALERMVVKKK